ncbi:hypothetical protein F4678DRAFT_460948 [Xylaria arbuscula]|nr:hypothetical protein F4678DRAFT_460948 [Xylaria arbuscula]
MEKWVAYSFCVETAASSADEFFSHNLKLPIESANCHWFPASSELAIVVAHWRWDGRGHIMMLDEFLTLLAEPDIDRSGHAPGNETTRLVPSLDEVIDVPNPPLTKSVACAHALLAPMTEGPSSIGLQVAAGPTPSDTVRAEIIIPEDITSTLREGCRARGIVLQLH